MSYHVPPTTLAEAMDTITGLDGYFKDCEDGGQGINTKEAVWMNRAMVFALKAIGNPFTAMSEIADQLTSNSARCQLVRAIDETNPKIRQFFAPAEDA